MVFGDLYVCKFAIERLILKENTIFLMLFKKSMKILKINSKEDK